MNSALLDRSGGSDWPLFATGSPAEGDAVLVLDGQMDVFLAELKHGEPEGARHHLLHLEAGEVMPAVAMPAGSRTGLLLIPASGARCYELPMSGLAEHWQDQGTAEWQRQWQAWLTTLGVLFHEVPGEHGAPLAEGEHANDSPRPQILYPASDVVQIQVVAGDVSLGGCLDALLPEDVWLPLPTSQWLSAAPGARWQVRGGSAYGDIHDALEGVLQLLPLLLVAREQQLFGREALQLRRLQEYGRRDRQSLQGALHKLAAVVDPRLKERGVGEMGDNALLGACRLLGGRLGIEFTAPPKLDGERETLNPVREIAEASAVRCREVALHGRWWEDDNGPLLAFTEEGKEPLALLPQHHRRPDRRYVAHNPRTDESEPVDAAFAERLNPFAWSFYRKLPEHPLGLLDILRFGTFGVFREILVVVAVGLLAGLLGMAIPLASGYLFDTVFPAADKPLMVQVVLALLIASVVGILFDLTRTFAILRIESRMGHDLQAAVWDRVLKLPTTFFRDYSVGDLAMRINGINSIREALSGTVMGSLMSALFSMLNVFLLFYYSPMLAMVAIGLVLLSIAFSAAIGYLSMRIARQVAEQEGEVSGLVFELLSGIVKLRVSAAQTRAFAKWSTEFARLRGLQWRAGRLQNVSQVFNSMFPILANAAIFTVVAVFLLKDQQSQFSTGSFVAFTAAFGMFLSSTLSIAETAIDLLNIVPLFERTKPILQAVPEASSRRAHPGRLKGGIEISNLTFAYSTEDPPVLSNISLSIRPGEFVALVGPSGSGKSTLLRLLLGFEQPQSGALYFDGNDLSDLDLGAVRRQLGVVLQNGRLMSGDIFTNIIGSSTLTMDDAVAAAKASGLYEDIRTMPMGMHTWVSEGGSTLSGGQRQRLLIARALVNSPRIILFDEATSALDNRTQAVVSASMDKMRVTRIVVAHRLSTILNADRIVVLDRGRVIQSGTYDELVSQPGLFSELAQRQIA